MSNLTAHRNLSEFNNIFKENDNIYHKAATALGLSDCTLWILYILRWTGKACTQSGLCESLSMPKQTINSSLKKLEADGFIELHQSENRRSKQILLTDRGLALAERTADRVLRIEQEAMSGLTEEEQESLVYLFRKYTSLLGEKISAEMRKQ